MGNSSSSPEEIPKLEDPKHDEPCALIILGVAESWSGPQVGSMLKRLQLSFTKIEKQRGESAAVVFFKNNKDRSNTYYFLNGCQLADMSFEVKPFQIYEPPPMSFATEADILKFSTIPTNDPIERKYPLKDIDLSDHSEKKKQQVISHLSEIIPEGLQISISTPQQSVSHFSCTFIVGLNSYGEVAVGLNSGSRMNQSIVQLDSSDGFPEAAISLAQDFASFVKTSIFPPYDANSETGKWQSLHIQITSTNDVLMAVVTQGGLSFSETDRLISQFSSKVQSLYWVKTSPGQTDDTANRRVLAGKSYILEKLADHSFSIYPFTTFPNNISGYEFLVQRAAALSHLDSSTVLVDATCGIGINCMAFIPYIKRAIGIDTNQRLINTAEKNIEINNMKKIYVTCSEIDQILPGIATNLPRSDKLVCLVNGRFPSKISKEIAMCHRAEGLIYITENATSLAYDVIRIFEGTMKIESVELFDLEPHKTTVMTVAYLARI